MDLLAWYNLIYLIPLGIGLLVAIGSTLGFHSDGDHSVESGAHDLDHDVDHDVDHDTDHDADHDTDQGSKDGPLDSIMPVRYRSPLYLRVLSAFGVGRVPLTIVILTVSLIFGGTGLILNMLVSSLVNLPVLYVPLSLTGSLVVATVLSSRLSGFISTHLPMTETYAIQPQDLVGRSGKLVLAADEKRGLLQIRDSNNDLQQVQCRTSGSRIAKNKAVVVADYDAKKRLYIVCALPKEIEEVDGLKTEGGAPDSE